MGGGQLRMPVHKLVNWLIEKRNILSVFNAAALFCRHSSFLQLFQKFVQSPTFIQKFLNKFFYSITFKNVQILHWNSMIVAKTHVYTSNHWHQTVVCYQTQCICSRIAQFSAECSAKITVYQSVQNLYQIVKHPMINSRYWINVMSNVTLHVNAWHLTVEDWLLIKTSQIEKGSIVEKWLLSFQWDSEQGNHGVWSLINIECTGFLLKGWVVGN